MYEVNIVTGSPKCDVEYLGYATYQFFTQVSKKTITQKLFGNAEVPFFDGVAGLKKLARDIGGDIVYDIKLSTTTATYSSDGTYVITSIIATVGRIIENN